MKPINTGRVLEKSTEPEVLPTFSISVGRAHMPLVDQLVAIAQDGRTQPEDPAKSGGTYTYLFVDNASAFARLLVANNIPFTMVFTPNQD